MTQPLARLIPDDGGRGEPAAGGDYTQVRGLTRGLDILEALNAAPFGSASATGLAAATGIHRTTVKRLLETLRAAGFVHFRPGANEYALAARVQRLARGYGAAQQVLELARGAMQELTREVLWPSDLMLPDGGEMVVQETSHPLSPWSFNSRALGTRVPMLRSAGGSAYLAWCSEQGWQRFFRWVEEARRAGGFDDWDEAEMRRIIRRTRERGYAVTPGQETHGRLDTRFGSGKCWALAAPVRVDGDCVAVLNVVYLRSAVSPRVAAERFAPALVATCRGIEAQLAAERAEDASAPPVQARIACTSRSTS